MMSEQISSEEFFNNSYSKMFLAPPFGTPSLRDYSGFQTNNIYDTEKIKVERRAYTLDDFNRLNDLLFPKGKDSLDILRWSTNWSDYFDFGNEWWGAMCVSIYDKLFDRYVVIMVSASD